MSHPNSHPIYSPIYLHSRIYEGVMRILYRGCYEERIQAVANRIPDNVQVADVCAGDCSLYRYGLQHRSVKYCAYDINPRFIAWAKRRNIDAHKIDLRTNEIPSADCVVMLSALYQFIPNEREILNKLLQSARMSVILTEPIHNVAQSAFPFVAWVGKQVTRVGDNPCAQRFTEETLRALLDEYSFQSVNPIAGGRELLAIHTVG